MRRAMTSTRIYIQGFCYNAMDGFGETWFNTRLTSLARLAEVNRSGVISVGFDTPEVYVGTTGYTPHTRPQC